MIYNAILGILISFLVIGIIGDMVWLWIGSGILLLGMIVFLILHFKK